MPSTVGLRGRAKRPWWSRLSSGDLRAATPGQASCRGGGERRKLVARVWAVETGVVQLEFRAQGVAGGGVDATAVAECGTGWDGELSRVLGVPGVGVDVPLLLAEVRAALGHV